MKLTTKRSLSDDCIYPTAQQHWIAGKGLLLWSGLFFVEVGAALFLISAIFNSLWGAILGWLFTACLGGGTHLLFLGRPFRIWRAIKRPQSSWISRGLYLMTIFLFFGFVHFALSIFAEPVTWVTVVAGIFAALTIAYGGYEVADVKPIPVWHSSLLPIQLFVRSVCLAFLIMLAGYLLMGKTTIAHGANVKFWINIGLIINAGLFIGYLLNLLFDEGEEKLTLDMIIKGELKGIFWPWVGIGGIIIPLIIAITNLNSGASASSAGLLLLAVLLQFIADPMLRYCSMRGAYYTGLFPCKPVRFPKAAS